MATLAYILLSCLLVSNCALANPVAYKCQAAEGHIYQSVPCEGLELKRWGAAADPARAASFRHLEALQSGKRSEAPALRSQRRRREAAPVLSACEKVRRGRDQAYASAGLRRSFALSSFWDNKVHQACR